MTRDLLMPKQQLWHVLSKILLKNPAELNPDEKAFLSVERVKAKRDLLTFSTMIDPLYGWPPHLQLLTQKLEQLEQIVASGGQANLLITMPPRHGKSETCSKKWPAWVLGKHPDWCFIASSYNTDLPESFSRYVRDTIVKNEMFKAIFPGVELDPAAQRVDRWKMATASKYSFIAAGVSGGITGYGGNILLVDDPIKNRAEAESPTIRENNWSWYKTTLRTRREPASAIVIIMTRWHSDDLHGRIKAAYDQWLAEGEYDGEEPPDHFDVLELPAISEDDPPRALWPQRFSIASLKTTRASLGTYDWSALYLGRPFSGKGALFLKTWFEGPQVQIFTSDFVNKLDWSWAWDFALTTKQTSNYTVGLQFAFDKDQNFWLRHRIKARMEAPQVRKMVKHNILATGQIHYMETNFFQRALIQELMQDPELQMSRHLIKGIAVDKDKKSRALPVAARAEAGKFFINRAIWTEPYIDVMCRFTGHGDLDDDDVDATSLAFQAAGSELRLFRNIKFLSI